MCGWVVVNHRSVTTQGTKASSASAIRGPGTSEPQWPESGSQSEGLRDAMCHSAIIGFKERMNPKENVGKVWEAR